MAGYVRRLWLSMFVLDFSDAFWHMPIHKRELEFFCAVHEMAGIPKYVLFVHAVQGSRRMGSLGSAAHNEAHPVVVRGIFVAAAMFH